LRTNTYRFLRRYGFEYFGPDSGLPLVMLSCGNNGDCPFLRPNGCSVYEDRLGSCRNYPLIRRIESGTNKVEYFLQQPPEYCKGRQTNLYQTAREWLNVSKLKEYHKYNDWFMKLLFKISFNKYPESFCIQSSLFTAYLFYSTNDLIFIKPIQYLCLYKPLFLAYRI